MMTLLPIAFNFLLFAVLLFVLLKKSVVEMFELRHLQLKDEVERVQTQLVESQRRLEEYDSRFKTIEQEKANMISFSKSEAEKQALKLINDAHRIAKNIESDAGQTAHTLREQAVVEIRNQFASKVLAKAEAGLKTKLTGADRVRILNEFSGKLEGTS